MAVPRREPFHGPDVRTAATAEDERPLRKAARDREILLAERVFLDDRDLGVRKRQASSLGHRLAAFAPGLGDAKEPRRELSSAGVALVARTEGDCRVGVAARALGAES